MGFAPPTYSTVLQELNALTYSEADLLLMPFVISHLKNRLIFANHGLLMILVCGKDRLAYQSRLFEQKAVPQIPLSVVEKATE